MLQDIVALSTIESEYMSMTEGIKKVIWLHGLIQSLHMKVDNLLLYYDSQGMLNLANKSYVS